MQARPIDSHRGEGRVPTLWPGMQRPGVPHACARVSSTRGVSFGCARFGEAAAPRHRGQGCKDRKSHAWCPGVVHPRRLVAPASAKRLRPPSACAGWGLAGASAAAAEECEAVRDPVSFAKQPRAGVCRQEDPAVCGPSRLWLFYPPASPRVPLGGTREGQRALRPIGPGVRVRGKGGADLPHHQATLNGVLVGEVREARILSLAAPQPLARLLK